MVTLGMTVAQNRRKNTATTRTTSTIATAMVNWTSAIEARINSVRS